MTERCCEFCEGPLPIPTNARTRFCCASHRAAAHRARRSETRLDVERERAADVHRAGRRDERRLD